MATVTYTIPDPKLAQFKTWFLAQNPIPLDENKQPLMSDNDWIKECGKRYFLNICMRGKDRLAVKQAVFDTEIIE